MVRQGGFLITKIHQLQSRVFERLLKERCGNEINPAQGRVLFVLWQQDSLSMQELARQTALEKSTLTRMLERLESVGYAARLPDQHDRRKVTVCLTQAGQRLRDIYEAVSAEMAEIFYAGLTAAEIDAGERLLVKILNNLTDCEDALKTQEFNWRKENRDD